MIDARVVAAVMVAASVAGCWRTHGRSVASPDVGPVSADAGHAPDSSAALDAFVALDAPTDSPPPHDGAPDPGDAWSPPPCDPSSVTWATASAWLCGTSAAPRVTVLPIEAAWATASANSCGLGVWLGDGSFPFAGGGSGGRFASQRIAFFDHAGTLRWEEPVDDEFFSVVTRADGSLVVRTGDGYRSGWTIFDGVAWGAVYSPPITFASYDELANLDPDGTVHAFASTEDAASFGLDPGPAFIEITMRSDGTTDARSLARGRMTNATATRASGERLFVRAQLGSFTWLDGTTTTSDGSVLVVLDHDRVSYTETDLWAPLVLPHPGGTFTTIRGAPQLEIGGFRIERREGNGALIWSREYPVGRSAPAGSVRAYSAIERPDGRVVVGGQLYMSPDFGDLHYAPAGPSAALLFEVDPCGDVLWARAFGGAGGLYDQVTSVSLRPDGRVVGVAYVSGISEIDGHPIGDASNYRSVFFELAP